MRELSNGGPQSIGILSVFPKIHTLHQLHGEKALLFIRDQLVKGYEVGMTDVRQSTEFPLESEERWSIQVMESFEGNRRVSFAVKAAIDRAKPTRAETILDQEPVGSRKCVFTGSERISVVAERIHRGIDGRIEEGMS